MAGNLASTFTALTGTPLGLLKALAESPPQGSASRSEKPSLLEEMARNLASTFTALTGTPRASQGARQEPPQGSASQSAKLSLLEEMGGNLASTFTALTGTPLWFLKALAESFL